MSVFAQRLREVNIRASSPDGTVVMTATGRGELDVRVDAERLRGQSDQTFQRELQACVTSPQTSEVAARGGVEASGAGG